MKGGGSVKWVSLWRISVKGSVKGGSFSVTPPAATEAGFTHPCKVFFPRFGSGFLVAFGTLKMLKKTRGRLNWALFYVARFLRLTPIYMFILFFYITISLHFISGPYEVRP